VVAVAVVVLLVGGVGYHAVHAPPLYLDTATVAFSGAPGPSLLAVDQVMASVMMSAQAEQQVRLEGGDARYDAALVNLYSEQFPYYGIPYLTVTTASIDPVATQRTFAAVMRVLKHDLASLQAQAAGSSKARIQATTIAAPTGPIPQTGSHKRSLPALALLTFILAFLVAAFLDRHPFRLRLRERLGSRPAGISWRRAPRRPRRLDPKAYD
jgi:hypothetical protein